MQRSFFSMVVPLGVMLAAMAGCSDDPAPAPVDSGMDVGDASPDVAPDGQGDAAPDVSPDVAPDVSMDAAADASPDAAADASPDAAADASPDVAADASPDVAADASPDAVADASPDVAADAAEDASEGGAPDSSIAARCTARGGTVAMSLCCASASDFPNTCTTGACGCAPGSSRMVMTCTCPSGQCFDGFACLPR